MTTPTDRRAEGEAVAKIKRAANTARINGYTQPVTLQFTIIELREIASLSDQLAEAQAEQKRMQEALEFYADPATYAAIAFLADRPCGEFSNDFDEDHGDAELPGPRPGKRARAALLPTRCECCCNGDDK